MLAKYWPRAPICFKVDTVSAVELLLDVTLTPYPPGSFSLISVALLYKCAAVWKSP